MVSTPFSRLALAARQATMKGESLTEKQQKEQIDRGKGRIQLLVTMRGGPSRSFARFYQPVLLVDGREVKATFVQNERTPLVQEDGRLAARNVYVFPLEGLPTNGAVTLLVQGSAAGAEGGPAGQDRPRQVPLRTTPGHSRRRRALPMVTKQRFAQGMTFQQYLDQMNTNKEKFLETWRRRRSRPRSGRSSRTAARSSTSSSSPRTGAGTP